MQSKKEHLVPIFVSDNHFMDDLFDFLISSFNSPIHLRSVRRRVVMLNLELFTELSDYQVVEIGTVSVMILSGIP